MSNETQNTQTTIEQESNLANPFSEESWIDPSVKVEEQNQGVDDYDNQTSGRSNYEEEDEIYDADEYLKQQLGFENWDEAKEAYEQLKNSRSEGIEFENEDSLKYYELVREQREEELINFLQEKRKINRLAESDIKDTNVAEEIIKLSMYQKNKELDQAEIDFLFNEKFQKPQKPVQDFDELDSDYDQRVANWENRINEIDKKLIIEAKLAKPEIEKLRSQLVLPEITPSRTNDENYSEEFIEANKYAFENFYQNIDTAINSFDGFNATVNEQGAEFNVAYVPNDEEKQTVANQLRFLGENNLDANMLFAQRWVNDNGTVNVEQITRDLFLLQNEGKITQKYVNEAANRRLALYLKKQSNIDLGETTPQGTYNPNNQQSEMDKLAAIMFAK